MDIVQILGKLHEVDKLKNILLDKEQLYLFNCTPKPVISKERDDDTVVYNNLNELIQDNLQ